MKKTAARTKNGTGIFVVNLRPCPRISNRRPPAIRIADLTISRRIEMPYDRAVGIVRAASAQDKESHEDDFP
jgi:hypothetical protein